MFRFRISFRDKAGNKRFLFRLGRYQFSCGGFYYDWQDARDHRNDVCSSHLFPFLKDVCHAVRNPMKPGDK